MIKTALVGFGNVGKYAYEAIINAPDMELCCIAEPSAETKTPDNIPRLYDISDIKDLNNIDVAVIGAPSRSCPDLAEALLNMGINTVDTYDEHAHIWDVKCRLDTAAKKSGRSCIISTGFDPGIDSVVRALLESAAPRGITYTNFGPGMSMGHSVAVKAIAGVENALSMTIPLGANVHRRMIYVQLKPGASVEEVTSLIKSDPYFAKDDVKITQVDDVAQYIDFGSGVHMIRKGVSGNTHNQIMEFSMRINNPALTAQVLASTARAAVKQRPGCYTLIEIPVIDLLPGDKKDIISRLV
jgi:diaminopimelate dehydrogenase